MDPARIDRIVSEARQAAAEGLQGAMEAVEQALRNMNISANPEQAASQETTGKPKSTPLSGDKEQVMEDAGVEQTQDGVPLEAQGSEAQAPKVLNQEQEREVILRMIAEGRITPDEGDMLLEALN